MSTIFELYLVFYLLARTKLIKWINTKYLLIVGIALSIFWMTITGLFAPTSKAFYSCFLTFLWVFTFGIVVAIKICEGGIIFHIYKRIIPIITISVLIVAYGICAIVSVTGVPFSWYNDLFSGIGFIAFTIMITHICGNGLKRIFSFINTFSFEWYLTHILVFDVLYKVILPQTSSKIVSVCLALFAFAVSAAFAWLYSKGSRYVINKIMQRR